MTDHRSVDAAADRLWKAWQTGRACEPVRDLLDNDNLDAAYQVQMRNEARVVRDGDSVVGRKIGLTSAAVQQQLGVDQPDFGPLFASRNIPSGGVVDLAPLIAPRIEGEIALILGAALDDPNIDRGDVRRATHQVSAALEIVDSRIANWDIGITDTVADFASGAAFVLGDGPIALGTLDLASVPMTMRRDDEEVCTGTGAATLGDPFEAALWLARTLARRGTPLVAGDVVLTGALGPFVRIDDGQHIHADFGPLGSVSVAIERSTT